MFQKIGKDLQADQVKQFQDPLLPTKALLEEASQFFKHRNADLELKRRIEKALEAIEEISTHLEL